MLLSNYIKLVTSFLLQNVLSFNREEVITNEEFNNQINIPAYRAKIIKSEFQTAWSQYEKYAFGADEIRPITGKPVNGTWNSWGVTLVDALDTLWLMDLKQEFQRAIKVVANTNYKYSNQSNSFFEITIRYLAGLISAYDLSGEKIFLDKAVDLADYMLNDFNSSAGIPYVTFNFKTGKPDKSERYASLANVGTCQLEFTRLSILTGNPKYRTIANKVYDILDQNKKERGLYNSVVDVETGKFATNAFSFGGGADSFFEYLIKLPIMLGPKDKASNQYLRMFNDSIDQMYKLLFKSCKNGKKCLGRIDGNNNFINEMHHLEFFVPGMLLLGSDYFPNKGLKKTALDLLEVYSSIPAQSKTGLAPENTRFSNNIEVEFISPENILRPELAESLFYAYRYTGDSKYQEISWKLFSSFQKYSKANYGFAEYNDVNKMDKELMQHDVMQSFFFAETMKYLYLIQAPNDTLNLNNWVFNTEAHPFKISK